jgi:small subunit ribosomal protein S18
MTNENPNPSTPQQAAPAPAGGPARGPQAGPRRPFGRRHFAPRRKVCRLCAEKIHTIDYKQSQLLKTFCTDTGKILSRRITGACAKHQRQITRAIKINRNLAIMPYKS